MRILLAEDDTSMREYLQRALQRVGYRVDAVDRGTAALALLEKESFDLLLTDIVMPEMDGIELAQKAAVISPAFCASSIPSISGMTMSVSKRSNRSVSSSGIAAVPRSTATTA